MIMIRRLRGEVDYYDEAVDMRMMIMSLIGQAEDDDNVTYRTVSRY